MAMAMAMAMAEGRLIDYTFTPIRLYAITFLPFITLGVYITISGKIKAHFFVNFLPQMFDPPKSCFTLAALDNMEGENRHENSIQLNSLDFGGTSYDASCSPKGPDHDCPMATGRKENQLTVTPLPQWISCQPASQNNVKSKSINSIFVREASGKDIIEGIPAPFGSIHIVNGISELETEILYNNSRDAWCSKPSTSIFDMKAQKLGHLNTYIEGEPVNELTRVHHQTSSQNHTSWEQKVTNNVPQHLRVTVAKPGFYSRRHDSVARKRALATDRRRRLLIKERLKAVHELHPHSQQTSNVTFFSQEDSAQIVCLTQIDYLGSEAATWDDIVEHVKYLQHQVKELTQSRLGGESVADPFIFLEGYGHYMLNEHMLKESLEEMIGKLFDVNPSAATQLLESRGLFAMPMALAEGLKATQMIN